MSEFNSVGCDLRVIPLAGVHASRVTQNGSLRTHIQRKGPFPTMTKTPRHTSISFPALFASIPKPIKRLSLD